MKETYITLNCRSMAFLIGVLNIPQPTNNYEIFSTVNLCVRQVRVYEKLAKKENKIADFGSTKLMDSRDDKNLPVVWLLRHSEESMHDSRKRKINIRVGVEGGGGRNYPNTEITRVFRSKAILQVVHSRM